MTDAFHDFWLAHADWLEAYVWSLRYPFNDDEVHDAVLEAFHRLEAGWSADLDYEDVRRELCVFARSRALDMLRRRLALGRITQQHAPQIAAPFSPAPEAHVVAMDERHRLRLAFARLRPRDRELLADHYLHGKSYAALAAESGRTEAAIRQTVSRSIAKVRRALQVVAGAVALCCARLIRRGVPATVVAMPVAMHTVLLAIAITSLATNPLPALPLPRAEAVVVEIGRPRLVAAPLPVAVLEGTSHHSGGGSVGLYPTGSSLVVPGLPQPQNPVEVPEVTAPCLTKSCRDNGDTVSIAVVPGVEQEVSQPYVELCERVPSPTKPGSPVTCHNGG